VHVLYLPPHTITPYPYTTLFRSSALTITKSNPIPFGTLPADTFLPRFPAGKYVSRRSRILPGRSHRAIRRRARDLHRRCISAPTDRRVARIRTTDRSNGNDSDLSN